MVADEMFFKLAGTCRGLPAWWMDGRVHSDQWGFNVNVCFLFDITYASLRLLNWVWWNSLGCPVYLVVLSFGDQLRTCYTLRLI